jgi:hypothetical protein
VPGLKRVDWYVDGVLAASTAEPRYGWPLKAGTHDVKAQLWTDTVGGAGGPHATDDIRFYVH